MSEHQSRSMSSPSLHITDQNPSGLVPSWRTRQITKCFDSGADGDELAVTLFEHQSIQP